MKLIADSGSTKTDWALVDDGGHVNVIHTQGINPVHQTDCAIADILRNELMAQLDSVKIDEVFFYGSGVRPTEETVMQRLLAHATGATSVEAKSDLLGAARALCGQHEGLACILGTGANSCLYDGRQIAQNTPPLGYILGDEGSGAVLGIGLLNALYKGLLPETLRKEFEAEYHLSLTEVISRVYRQPMANRFLASLSPFVHAHLQVPAVHALVVRNFQRFLQHNVNVYGRRDLPLSAVGSIAFYYEDQLREAANGAGYVVGRIERSPLQALIAYHLA